MKSLLSEFEKRLIDSKIIDNSVSAGGTFTWLPDGTIMHNLFIEAVKKIFLKYSFQECIFPTIVSNTEFKNIANSIKDFSKNVYWLDENKLLRPSGESIIYPHFRRWINTYKDLPIRVFQVGQSFRNVESRGIFRLKETEPFIELHTAHSTRCEAEKQVETNIQIFKEILDFMGLPAIQSQRPPWGNNPVAEKIIAFDTLMPNGETIHLNSVYSQMQVFSKPYKIEFYNNNNQKDYTYQTEFGFGARMIFSILFLAMDEKGLNIPPQIAPKQIVIAPISLQENEKSMAYVNKIKTILENTGYRIFCDNNTKYSIGKKRYLYETRGVPIRIEIGQNEINKNMVTLISRETNNRVEISLNSIIEQVNLMLTESKNKIKNRIKTKHSSNIIKFLAMDAGININIEKGKVAKFPLCFTERCCKAVEKNVRGEVMGYNFKTNLNTCIVCGNKTNYVAFMSRHL